MKRITTTINEKGQVTIPVAVRRVLGVKPGDKVTFTHKRQRSAPVTCNFYPGISPRLHKALKKAGGL